MFYRNVFVCLLLTHETWHLTAADNPFLHGESHVTGQQSVNLHVLSPGQNKRSPCTCQTIVDAGPAQLSRRGSTPPFLVFVSSHEFFLLKTHPAMKTNIWGSPLRTPLLNIDPICCCFQNAPVWHFSPAVSLHLPPRGGTGLGLKSSLHMAPWSGHGWRLMWLQPGDGWEHFYLFLQWYHKLIRLNPWMRQYDAVGWGKCPPIRFTSIK